MWILVQSSFHYLSLFFLAMYEIAETLCFRFLLTFAPSATVGLVWRAV